MTIRAGIAIFFNDGSKLSFVFPQQDVDKHTYAQRMERLLQGQYLMIEAEDSLFMFPVTSIKYIEISPTPEHLPETVIRRAQLAGQGT